MWLNKKYNGDRNRNVLVIETEIHEFKFRISKVVNLRHSLNFKRFILICLVFFLIYNFLVLSFNIYLIKDCA